MKEMRTPVKLTLGYNKQKGVLMKDQLTTIYVLCDEYLKAIGHKDDKQCRMSSAEVMTTALCAALFLEETRPNVVIG